MVELEAHTSLPLSFFLSLFPYLPRARVILLLYSFWRSLSSFILEEDGDRPFGSQRRRIVRLHLLFALLSFSSLKEPATSRGSFHLF